MRTVDTEHEVVGDGVLRHDDVLLRRVAQRVGGRHGDGVRAAGRVAVWWKEVIRLPRRFSWA